MSEEKKPKLSAGAIAAFLAGAGLGAGTTITINEPGDVPDAGAGWKCEVLANHDVLCAPFGGVVIAQDDLVVRLDGGSPDAGPKD